MAKRIIIAILILSAISLTIYFLWKRKRDKEDRIILNGKTRSEFLDVMRKAWESEYRTAMKSYVNDTTTDWNQEIRKDLTERGLNIQSTEYHQAYEDAKQYAVDFAWSKDPNPMDIDWARQFWVPKVTDEMNVNVNDDLVQKLLYKI